jgi:hypothetical protein
MESRVQLAIEAIEHLALSNALQVMEHLAILRRWFYRGTRVGEMFLADEKGALPMRRIVRGIARVYRGEAPESAPLAPGGALPG